MPLDSCVLKVKENLKKAADNRFDVMCKLTEPKNPVYLQDYSTMWQTIKKHHDTKSHFPGHDDHPENLWVYVFLGAVVSAIDQPPYFYYSDSYKKKLIDEIREASKTLQNLYQLHCLDAGLEYLGLPSPEDKMDMRSTFEDVLSVKGFYIYESFFDKDDERLSLSDYTHSASAENNVSISEPKAILFSEIINLFADRAEAEMGIKKELLNPFRGNKSKNAEAIRFSRILSTKIKALYGQPLNKVVKTAVFAMYGVEYSEADIHNHQNR